jgi:hypothetical protein
MVFCWTPIQSRTRRMETPIFASTMTPKSRISVTVSRGPILLGLLGRVPSSLFVLCGLGCTARLLDTHPSCEATSIALAQVQPNGGRDALYAVRLLMKRQRVVKWSGLG